MGQIDIVAVEQFQPPTKFQTQISAGKIGCGFFGCIAEGVADDTAFRRKGQGVGALCGKGIECFDRFSGIRIRRRDLQSHAGDRGVGKVVIVEGDEGMFATPCQQECRHETPDPESNPCHSASFYSYPDHTLLR